jgi:hypothetical protein
MKRMTPGVEMISIKKATEIQKAQVKHTKLMIFIHRLLLPNFEPLGLIWE